MTGGNTWPRQPPPLLGAQVSTVPWRKAGRVPWQRPRWARTLGDGVLGALCPGTFQLTVAGQHAAPPCAEEAHRGGGRRGVAGKGQSAHPAGGRWWKLGTRADGLQRRESAGCGTREAAQGGRAPLPGTHDCWTTTKQAGVDTGALQP